MANVNNVATLTLRDLVDGDYSHLKTLDDLRRVLQSANDFDGMMTRLNPSYWMPAMRVLGMQKIPDMLIVFAISLGGLLFGIGAMYLVLYLCLPKSARHPRLRLRTYTRSNAVHVIALGLKIIFVLGGLYTALSTVGIDPISTALSLGVVSILMGYAFQRPAGQIGATFTLTSSGLIAEGMEVVVPSSVGIVKGEITAVGQIFTTVQGQMVGNVNQVLGLPDGTEGTFYIPNEQILVAGFGRFPSLEDDVTTTGEGKPSAPAQLENGMLPGPGGLNTPHVNTNVSIGQQILDAFHVTTLSSSSLPIASVGNRGGVKGNKLN